MDQKYKADISQIDSPALLVYPDIIKQNINTAITMIGDVSRLRPHAKTSKIAEVSQCLLDAGISKFKCATIAEAEMLGRLGAPDVLLAYQLTGPKIERFFNLVRAYPATAFSSLVDCLDAARELSQAAVAHQLVIPVFVDMNVGMNRTGIKPQNAIALINDCQSLAGIQIKGLHVYDGHLHDADVATRQAKSDPAFEGVQMVQEQAGRNLIIIAGGSPTYPVHIQRAGVECSPGTFVFWDWNYKNNCKEQAFEYAALLLTRVVSVIDENTICTDLGHKSVAAENPLPRVHFLNAPEAVPIGQSEEHLVLRVPDSGAFPIGTVLYGVPVHICPTVALYEKVQVIENGSKTGEWKVVARDRCIHY